MYGWFGSAASGDGCAGGWTIQADDLVSRKPSGIAVTFGDPLNGWLPFSLSHFELEFSENFSYTPNDFVSELVTALRSMMAGASQATANASCEPGGYEIRFTATDDLTLDIQFFPDFWMRPRKHGESVFSVTLPPACIVRPFWRALTDLASRDRLSDYESQMRRRFPSRELEVLGEAIRAST